MEVSIKLAKTALLVFIVSWLSACSAGGSDSTPPPATGDKWDQMNWDEGKWN